MVPNRGGEPNLQSEIRNPESMGRVGLIRRFYDWVLHWAETPYGPIALFLLAVAESSFFPIPPDVLLIALAIAIPHRAFRYVAICSLGSVVGGLFGYLIGYYFMTWIGQPILAFYHAEAQFAEMGALYHKYDAWALGIAGFTPIPYKVFTIAAGAFRIKVLVFVLVSAISRTARFLLVGGLIYRFGPAIKPFIEKYLNWLTLAFALLLIGGFIIIRYVLD